MSEVIDWDEAMQQCGDDEEFLRELLADLRSETETQMSRIEETIRVGTHSIYLHTKCWSLSRTIDVSLCLRCGALWYSLPKVSRLVSVAWECPGNLVGAMMR